MEGNGVIRLEAIDLDNVEVVAEVRLGDSWGPYQAAVKAAGGRNRKIDGAWYTFVPIDRSRELEDGLHHIGLTVSIGPGLAACRDQETTPPDQLILVDQIEAQTGMRLFGFQRDGVSWLASKRSALLLDQMGIGKSCQALMSLPEGAACLVVCPAAVKAVWLREAARFRPELDVEVLSGRGSFRWPEPGQIVVTNFELLPPSEEEAHKVYPLVCAVVGFLTGSRPTFAEMASLALPVPPPEGVVVISDEASSWKSWKAQRTKRFRAIGQAVRQRAGRTWLLTGTPLTNKPPDLWGVLQAAGLAEATFGTWAYFAEVMGGYQRSVTATKKVWAWGQPNGPEVAGRLRAVSLRRHKADVLTELPAKQYELLTETELGKRDRKALDRVWEAIERADLDTDDEGRQKMPSFEGMSEARAILAEAKLPLLESIVESHEDAAEPLVVWSAHRAPVEVIGHRPGWGLLTGSVSLEERTRLVERFQAGELLGLACTIAAAGVGLTMTRACHEVFLDLDWTPAMNEQAEDRLHRISQVNTVLVTILAIDHPLDHRILELCAWKKGIFDATIGASATWRASVPTTEQLVKHDAERELRRPRPPETDAELWAATALTTLSGMDPDGAREVNAVGWNRIDGPFGHRLALRLAKGLSESQWTAAIRMCRKYHRQVGRCPEEAQGARRPEEAQGARRLAQGDERLRAGEVVGVDQDGPIVVEYVSKYPESMR